MAMRRSPSPYVVIAAATDGTQTVGTYAHGAIGAGYLKFDLVGYTCWAAGGARLKGVS